MCKFIVHIHNMNKYYISLFLSLLFFISCKKEANNKRIINKTEQNNILLNKKYNEVCFLMTHNAMNNTEKGYLLPNQTHSISKQLQNGVRGLMIDTYDGANGIALTYHAVEFAGKQNLKDVLLEINSFLITNPNEIVSIIFENNGSNTQLIKAIQDADLERFAYIHDGTWDTLNVMIKNNNRLVIFVEYNKTPTTAYMHFAWANIFDTKFQYKNANEFDCNINRGSLGANKLFLINHWLSNFLGIPDKSLANKANNKATISKRVNDCSEANNHFVNFLGVDFYEIGQAKAIVDSINGIN